ncbi:hypothetical protein DQ04_09031010 [Trypanosoma grayi]|uniref:hypothetical protein n=1 Tax=Trypanosoma grayi TaxID=71804 RepID=UPI0004F469C2|nr:hypothetical protein DQ04_09031010 [Trypanosoma grayi]KEG07707.1 hypothetical protein DQ04_09031010 [Trypanosoma grayi]
MKMTSRRSHYALQLVGVVYLLVIIVLWCDNSSRRSLVFNTKGDSRVKPLYFSTQTLIMVPGHGVLNALNASDWRKEENWGVEPHQRREGVLLPYCFASHIRRGLEILKNNLNSSLLIFSGGQTRAGTGPRSEALSYYLVAEETELFGLFGSRAEQKKVLEKRVFAEEFARDSYENLLFSIARFYEVTGRFPDKIIVVGWKHKKERFTKYHRRALRFPGERFVYVGLDFEDAGRFVDDVKPYLRASPYSDAIALSFVREDMYLCSAGGTTRTQRNPLFRSAPYEVSSPPLRFLLRHCGPRLIDGRLVPWG